MNIFEIYLNKILDLIKKANQDNLIELPENLSGINVDIPPSKYNCDMSTPLLRCRLDLVETKRYLLRGPVLDNGLVAVRGANARRTLQMLPPRKIGIVERGVHGTEDNDN